MYKKKVEKKVYKNTQQFEYVRKSLALPQPICIWLIYFSVHPFCCLGASSQVSSGALVLVLLLLLLLLLVSIPSCCRIHIFARCEHTLRSL